MNPALPASVLVPDMAEWLRILISALAGMVTGISGGVVLEPLKQWVTRKAAARRARVTIYKEIAAMWAGFSLCGDKCDDKFAECYFKAFKPDIYEFYFDHHRESCYMIDDWDGIAALYAGFRTLKEQVLSGRLQPVPGARAVITLMKQDFEQKRLDKTLVEKFVRPSNR